MRRPRLHLVSPTTCATLVTRCTRSTGLKPCTYNSYTSNPSESPSNILSNRSYTRSTIAATIHHQATPLLRERISHHKLAGGPIKCTDNGWIETGRRHFFQLLPDLTNLAHDEAKPLTHFEKKILYWPQDQIFDVVADVESYHEFVPWCTGSRILTRHYDKDGKLQRFDAELSVGFKFLLKQAYVSTVTLEKPNSIKAVVSNSSLFYYLTNTWTFKQLEQGKTLTSFGVGFRFRSSLFNHLADVYLHEVAQRMVHVFDQRCHQVYGHQRPKVPSVPAAGDTPTTTHNQPPPQ